MAKKDLQQLQTIKERMIAAGIPEDEVNALVDPLKNELQRRVCGLVWEHTTTSIPDMEGKIPALTPVMDKNIVNDINGNNHVLIEGENLLALMAMQYTHIDENGKGMIDVIYIDPPYNTGSVSFAYNDKFEKSEWLSMMDIRLKLARNLLKDDGVIFVSIDDCYQSHTKLLMDDIFGCDNFVACCPRKTGAGNAAARNNATLRKPFDYLIIYKQKNTSFRKKIVGQKEYKLSDDYGNFQLAQFQATGSDATRESRPNLYYPIYVSTLGEFHLEQKATSDIKILPRKINGHDGRWMWSREKFIAAANRYLYYDGKFLYRKVYYNPDEDQNKYQVEQAWLVDSKFMNSEGTKLLKEVLQSESDPFGHPKPIDLIKWCVNLHPNKNAVVFDFFAGSGTTGHAVIDLNKEDSGHRQFILCTNNELGKEALKTAKKNGCPVGSVEYEGLGVCHAVTYPRMQNIFPDYPGNNLYYYRIDQDIAESTIDDVTIANMASRAVFYVAMKENVYNAERHDDYYLLYNDETDIAVVTDPDMDMFDVEDEIVPTAFSRQYRKVYCSIYEPCMRNGIEYIPYPKEVLDVLKAAKKYIRREVA